MIRMIKYHSKYSNLWYIPSDNHSRKSYSSTVTYLKTLEKQLNEERKVKKNIYI